jgi:nitroreductase / dihydropteridine reductase
MNLIENLQWRYATKKFDTARKIPSDQIEKLKRAVQLSVSSYGLQLYKVLIIEDPNLREKLKPASWGQDQITDASHLVVFCNFAEIKSSHIDEYVKLKAEEQNLDFERLKGYSRFMKRKLDEKSAFELEQWTGKQTYIALANLLMACAELKIDACPMEGFDPEEYNKILGLTEKGLSTAVIATIGYRSPEDVAQYDKKIRKPAEMLFEEF